MDQFKHADIPKDSVSIHQLFSTRFSFQTKLKYVTQSNMVLCNAK